MPASKCGAPCRDGEPCKALCKKGFERCYRHLDVKPDEECECVVCYLPIKKNNEAVLDCKHKFCKDCISDWIGRFKKTCPLCRQAMSDAKITQITGRPPPRRPMALELPPLAPNPLLLAAAALALPPDPPAAADPVHLPALPNPEIPNDVQRFMDQIEQIIRRIFIQ